MLKKYPGLTLKQLTRLAFRLGLSFKDKDSVIGLSGSLGAGKTTFIKSFAKTLGIKHIKSPTFTVLSGHKTKTLKTKNLYHLDLYRLNKSSDLNPLGITELIKMPARIIMIEWVDKFPKLKKSCDLLITIKFAGHNKRDVTLNFVRK
ncbi:MAG TPA: tRNA (adenosine(37)-N6)-threonylcarbamoyltransferase complex ATPase subunit type 1 TsaE [Patescibacteria group bacterium]|jgi:tRNA threonylcarbamoyladenosine biosynthesis protein TsaE|nr:tRNA (adenosine(37)-N6)-threonylcarbamoyltransferase complex ATPase subunit type 1 TsaE [Patescibacteria group bacterium]